MQANAKRHSFRIAIGHTQVDANAALPDPDSLEQIIREHITAMTMKQLCLVAGVIDDLKRCQARKTMDRHVLFRAVDRKGVPASIISEDAPIDPVGKG